MRVHREPRFWDDVAELRADGVGVHVLPMKRGLHPWSDLYCAHRLRRLVAGCDIVHLHSAKAGWIGRLACLSLDCRVIYSPHCFPFEQQTSTPWGRLYLWAERRCARRTDLLLAVSHPEAELASRLVLEETNRIRVLENAVDLHRVELEIGSPRRPQGATPRIFGFLGELRRQKDPGTFLRAAVQACRDGSPMRFALPDRGPLSGWARRFVRRERIQHLVDFVPVSSRSLAQLYRRIDVGALPSRWEGFPYTLLEAMGLGLPVIVSDLPVLERMLRPLNPDLLFTVGDAAGLASRIRQWSTASPQRVAALARRARQTVAAGHDSMTWGIRLRDIYRSLMDTEPVQDLLVEESPVSSR